MTRIPSPGGRRDRVSLAAAAAVALGLIVALVIWRVDGEDDGRMPTSELDDLATEAAAPPGSGATTSGSATTAPATTAAAPSVPSTTAPTTPTTVAERRDPRRWPFARDSIWNVPLGAAGLRVPAGLRHDEGGVTVDEDILILTPDAPQVDLVAHDGGWNAQVLRCAETTGEVLAEGLPVPTEFITDPGFLGATPNHAAAVLLADGDTLVQTQPLHRCQPGGSLVSQFLYSPDSLRNGSGIPGAHGGSAMSSLGGTIRLGELAPGGVIRHALKVNIDCAAFCSYADGDGTGTPGFRWPASKADVEAPQRYGGEVAALEMGALLALPAAYDVAALRSEPARIIAEALRRYGAYVVDDTRYPIFAFTTEWSPEGRVLDEFEAAWGHPLVEARGAACFDGSAACDWAKDLSDILDALEVVEDNTPAGVGGAGPRLGPCAPLFVDGTGGGATDPCAAG